MNKNKNKFRNLVAKTFVTCLFALSLTSCSEDIDSAVVEASETEEVTLPFKVDEGAKLIILKGSDYQSSNFLSEEQKEQIVKMYEEGGLIIIERPTYRQLKNFTADFLKATIKYHQKNLIEKYGLSQSDALERAKSSQESFLMDTRMDNIKNYTSAGKEDAVCAETFAISRNEQYFSPHKYASLKAPFKRKTSH